MRALNVLAILAVAVLFGSCASEFKIAGEDVPSAVLTAFSSKYPGAQNVEWEAEKTDGHLAFEAEFKLNGAEKEAYFKTDGTFLKEE